MSTKESIAKWSSLWTPPERLPLSQWCEKNLVLSPEYSARSGPITLFPFQREIFDAFTDPRVEEIDLMSGTQLVKTLFIQGCLAYVMTEDPGPALLVEPKDADCKAFSKERLAPMLRDIPLLAGVTDSTSKTGQDTLLQKDFPGGSLALAGSIAPGNLARRSIRYLFADELDKYPASAGNEGDPISLARERTVTFGSRRKIVLCCSPTTDRSRIARAYEDSDQRQPWVPCPKCGKFQVLDWSHVEWNNDLPVQARPATAYYECVHCGAHWTDLDRWAACEKIEWRARKPFTGKAGFWISHLYSPWKRLDQMVEDYLTKKHSNSRQQLQVFYNTTLAQVWKEEGTTPQEDLLHARREDYPFGDEAVVPKRGLFLVAGVDVQPDRLECEVVAFGRGDESWSIAYEVIRGYAADDKERKNPLPVTAPEVWMELERRILNRQWEHESGGTLSIWLTAIDTGDRPKPVYEFTLRHPQPAFSAAGGMRVHSMRSVVPIKGTADSLKVVSSVSNEDAARKRRGIKIVGIGTVAVKTALFDSLRFVKPDMEDAVPNACHFPDYSIDWFRGVCSEQRIVTEGGKVHFEKKNSFRNEPLDCRVYAIAASVICGIDRFTEAHWQELEARVKVSERPLLPGTAPRPLTPQPQRRIVGRFR